MPCPEQQARSQFISGNQTVLIANRVFPVMKGSMEAAIKRALDKAFRSVGTTNTCLAVAKLFSADPAPKTLSFISKKVNSSEGNTLITLDRLVREVGIMEHYPEFSAKPKQIIPKFRMKPKYLGHLVQYPTLHTWSRFQEIPRHC